jgi:hypothetical protein
MAHFLPGATDLESLNPRHLNRRLTSEIAFIRSENSADELPSDSRRTHCTCALFMLRSGNDRTTIPIVTPADADAIAATG